MPEDIPVNQMRYQPDNTCCALFLNLFLGSLNILFFEDWLGLFQSQVIFLVLFVFVETEHFVVVALAVVSVAFGRSFVVVNDVVDFLVFCDVRDHFHGEVPRVPVHVFDDVLHRDSDGLLDVCQVLSFVIDLALREVVSFGI
jgi:hypothetical protein